MGSTHSSFEYMLQGKRHISSVALTLMKDYGSKLPHQLYNVLNLVMCTPFAFSFHCSLAVD